MYIGKCSTRISLSGGSTDLQEFINIYGMGAVISFPCDIYSYITVFRDKGGYNKDQNTYIINYTKREEVESIDDINNDIARVVLKHFNCEPVTVSFHSDVFASGSGLASSSAYLLACIKAISAYRNIKLSTEEICKLAIQLERQFNPLTGYQDIYGCAYGGLKKMLFLRNDPLAETRVRYYNNEFLYNVGMYLRPTGVNRSSTKILSTINVSKTASLLPLVQEMHLAIKNFDTNKFLGLINEAWEAKKHTSNFIVENERIKAMDEELTNDPSVLAHRLCGAGNGGYFLIFKDRIFEKEIGDIEIKSIEDPLTVTKI